MALTQIAVIATSVYLHRTLAHRALGRAPGAEAGISVAVHRKTPRVTDREGDPYSPRLLGFRRIQLLNVAYYMREARNLETIRKFAPDIIEDRLERAIFSWGWLGLGLDITLLCLVLGLWPV